MFHGHGGDSPIHAFGFAADGAALYSSAGSIGFVIGLYGSAIDSSTSNDAAAEERSPPLARPSCAPARSCLLAFFEAEQTIVFNYSCSCSGC
jgi:hypothetical protein